MAFLTIFEIIKLLTIWRLIIPNYNNPEPNPIEMSISNTATVIFTKCKVTFFNNLLPR